MAPEHYKEGGQLTNKMGTSASMQFCTVHIHVAASLLAYGVYVKWACLQHGVAAD
jgi:hypothetical protein